MILKGEALVYFTSALDPIQLQWVHVVGSVIVGVASAAYEWHWQVLMDSIDGGDSWKTFSSNFLGVTLDWLEAEAN